MFKIKKIILILVFSLFSCQSIFNFNYKTVDLPKAKRIKLEPISKIEFDEIKESSGIVKSKKYPNLYWTHNDSDNQAKIYPINTDGKLIQCENHPYPNGIEIINEKNLNVKNRDWEDITMDKTGNLIIADIGNNIYLRKNLQLYILKEPDICNPKPKAKAKKIDITYPDGRYNAEAFFYANDKFYILTQDDYYTRLYKLDSLDENKVNKLKFIDEFAIKGSVSSADATKDGKFIAVLTYKAIWVFKKPVKNDDYFEGEIWWLPIKASQCEAVYFDGEDILITSESRNIYKLAFKDLIKVK